MKIETVTDEQLALLPVYRDKWIKIGLNCDPCDFRQAKKAAALAYQCVNLPPPDTYILADGPISAALIVLRDSVGASVRNSVRDPVVDSVWDSVRWSVGGPIWELVRTSVKDSVEDLVGRSVRRSVWRSVWGSVEGSVEGSVWDSVVESGYGSHDAPWLSIYDYYISVCGLKLPKIQGLLELAYHCGWWIPYTKIAILQHRHKTLRRDEQGRLHCDTGRAVEYRDGWGLSAWHGTTVPDEWVTGGPPKPQDVMAWKNIEQRRAACEIIGWDKIIQSLNARVIDKHVNPQIGTLLEANIPDSGRERFLQVQCGTGRAFVIPVPPGVHTALEANAMTYGLTSEEYNVEVRT